MTRYFRECEEGEAEFVQFSKCGEPDNLIIAPVKPKLKTIDWQVVIDLGLLCEFEDGISGGRVSELGSVSSWGFHMRGATAVWQHCRILPDQIIETHEDFSRRMIKAGLDFVWTHVSCATKAAIWDIKPSTGYTFELQP